MKTTTILSTILIILCCTACSKPDNYDGPNAAIKGLVKDGKSGALIEQDIEGGSKIIIKELGFANPVEQQLIFKVNGEYQNNLVFANKYDIYFNESNFVKPDTLKNYEIRPGQNNLDFIVQPYIRVTDVSIEKTENQVVANFTITPTVDDKVQEIGLFGHIDRIAGAKISLQRQTLAMDISSKDIPITCRLTLSANGFTAGQAYYFRVGALINIPNAKYNYAPAVRLTM